MNDYTLKQLKRPRRSKYNARRTIVDGITFDSAKEAKTYTQLRILQKANAIIGFQRQVPYVIWINGKKICTYRLDFLVQFADGHIEYWDVKGMKTSVYKLKKKMVEADKGITIIEV